MVADLCAASVKKTRYHIQSKYCTLYLNFHSVDLDHQRITLKTNQNLQDDISVGLIQFCWFDAVLFENQMKSGCHSRYQS